MHKSVLNVIIRPDHYSENGAKYPVVYLLHGAGSNQSDFVKNIPEIKEFADRFNVMLVCPDGGRTSWYFDSPIDSTMKYETYVAIELIKYIDQKYNTIKNKSGRAITGFSMGGHGAFYLSFRHQDVFGAAGSMSGGVDFRPFPTNWEIPKRLGSYILNQQNWEKNTVINMIDLVKDKPIKLIFDCGVDDFFYTVNKNLHQKMLDAKIPHDYIERPGKHTWDYWRNSIKYQMVFFNEFFKNSAQN